MSCRSRAVAIVDSIARPQLRDEHVVHHLRGDLGERSLEAVTSRDAAVRGTASSASRSSSSSCTPPIQRFLARWRPGDLVVYLGRSGRPSY